jgi:hypothetical protein
MIIYNVCQSDFLVCTRYKPAASILIGVADGLVCIEINKGGFPSFIQNKVGRLYGTFGVWIQKMNTRRTPLIEFREVDKRIQFNRGLHKDPVEEGEDTANIG